MYLSVTLALVDFMPFTMRDLTVFEPVFTGAHSLLGSSTGGGQGQRTMCQVDLVLIPF